jgi:uncharacterized protein
MTAPVVADAGFHPGEMAVQRRAGTRGEAARLARMLEPATLSRGFATFLADRTFLVMTGRSASGELWTSPLVGPPGFLEVGSPTSLSVHAAVPAGDPLHGLPPGQKVGLIAIEFATRRRLRINGLLTFAGPRGLSVEVEQAFGNCPQYIQQRVLAPAPAGPGNVRRGSELTTDDAALIRRADTFFLGTAHPARGADASPRGRAPGFVQVSDGAVWWPDYPGNNLFNSLGNLAVSPEAALLFFDFPSGRTLHLTGTAETDWSAPTPTGRAVRFTPASLVAAQFLPAHEVAFHPYPHNAPAGGASTRRPGVH